MHFADRLIEAVRRVGNPVLVGIDPRPEDLPPGFLAKFPGDRAGVARRCGRSARRWSTSSRRACAAVKFQAAYYEAYGPEGLAALHADARRTPGRGA